MSLSVVHSRALLGIEAPSITVETHLSNGLPGLSIVGLPETAVKESKDRVRSAIINSHLEFPQRRITINLAPADLPKQGGRYDLPIALGILAASGQIPEQPLAQHEFIGELALSGAIRQVSGALPAAIASRNSQRALIIPKDNTFEASLSDVELLPAKHLLEVCAHLHGRELLTPHPPSNIFNCKNFTYPQDLSEVMGQNQAKRALTIAAAGRHNLLMTGPPGTGKTMLASRLPSILPPLNRQQVLEIAVIKSTLGSGFLNESSLTHPPFRNPHHTASAIALVGGGSTPKPGEISLAHNGVLFLDELPEFQRQVLEVMREPLESGEIVISRARGSTVFPARFQLVAAMNPCPCGYYGCNQSYSEEGLYCRCTPEQIRRYRSKISGPLLDRIDLQVQVANIKPADLHSQQPGESSAQVRQKVLDCQQHQFHRNGNKYNSQLSGKVVDDICKLDKPQQDILDSAMDTFHLSARAYHRILKVARTIADLASSDQIETPHLTEALAYRQLQ